MRPDGDNKKKKDDSWASQNRFIVNNFNVKPMTGFKKGWTQDKTFVFCSFLSSSRFCPNCL